MSSSSASWIAMRVLLANKFFRPGAGAETAFFATRQLLSEGGHDVIDFAMASADNFASPQASYFAPERRYDIDRRSLRAVRDAGASVYSISARRAIRRLIRDERPDVAHLHNVYHQLTLSIVDELVAARVPIVMTLHDYKIVCPAYTLFTEGTPCRRCVGRAPVHVVSHKCIKGSTVASALGAAEAIVARTRGLYRRIDAFISPSRFLAELASSEVPRERVHVVPNFLPRSPERMVEAAREQDPYAFFAGRLEEVKGVRPLLEAFGDGRDGSARLVIAGDGPLRGEVERAASSNARIDYLGRVSRDEIDLRLRGAVALVIPSLWEENCPMIVLEARAVGTPVISASSGGLPELVDHGDDGLLIDAHDPGAIGTAVQSLADDDRLRARMVVSGLQRFEREHGPERHLARLMSVFASVTTAEPLAAGLSARPAA